MFCHSVISDPLLTHGLLPTSFLCPWNSLGKNTGVGSRSLLQGIFLTQGLNLGLLHCRQILYHLSHSKAPKIMNCKIKKLINLISSQLKTSVLRKIQLRDIE